MYQAMLDPTAVTGRRTGAWLIDFVFAGILAMVAFQATVNGYSDIPGNLCGDPDTPICSTTINEPEGTSEDGVAVWDEASDTSFFFESSTLWIPPAVFVAYGFLSFVLIEGISGGSLGKLILGLRVVKVDGGHAGIGRALLRFLCWIVDGIPYCFPLVALVTGMSTKGHRRIGDFAAGTFVVGVGDVGQPLSIPGVTPPPAMPYVAAAPGMPAPGSSPTGWGSAPSWGATGPEPAAPADTPPATEPQWDPQRNTYIQWDTARNSWLQWDEGTEQWKPIET
jgi:uncharacterized RDD family membrane protein YckC